MKFKKNIISNLILQGINIVIGFVTSILLARGLGTENQGEFAYYLLIFGIIATYGGLGLTNSTSYFLKRTKFRKDDIINNNITVLLILSIIYTTIIILFKNLIFLENIYILLTIWITYALTMLFTNLFLTIYVAEENIYIYNKYFIIIYILRGIIIGILYYTQNLNVISISALYTVIEFIKVIILLKGLKLKSKIYINYSIIKEELKYGMPLYFAGFFIYLNYRIDQIMIKQFLGNSQLGIYSIAVHLADLAFIFPDSIKSAFEGKLYNSKEEEKKHISTQILKFTFFITIIICIIGILCKPLVTVLYGYEYYNSGIAMVILLIGIPFVAIGKVAPAYFCTDGRTKTHLKVASTVLIINFVLNVILIPKININGAAIASTIAYIFYGIIYIILLKKDGITIKQLLVPQKKEILNLKENIIKTINRNKTKQKDTFIEGRKNE